MDIKINKTLIGPSHPVYFIADIASNHEGDLGKAKELVHACAESGVQAVKMQNYTAAGLVSDYGFRNLKGVKTHQDGWGKSVFDSYSECAIPSSWTQPLAELCAKLNLDYFTSPYSLELVREVAPFVAAFKMGSGDVTWHEELREMCRYQKPVLIATGASTFEEVEGAMQAALELTSQVLLMQCNTDYTAKPDESEAEARGHLANANLRVLGAYARRWPEVPLGLSDHTHGPLALLASVGLFDVCAVEKHFTLNNHLKGQDHPFSTTPEGWRRMARETAALKAAISKEMTHEERYRITLEAVGDKELLDLALGDGVKRVQDNERGTVVVQRRGVRAGRPLAAGTVLQASDLVVLRPCPTGALPPYKMHLLLGKKLRRDVPDGDVVALADVD